MIRTEWLIDVLLEARALLVRHDNDFSWSSWEDAHAAVTEVDGLLSRLRTGEMPLDEIATIFLPTGPMQEVSLSSGWGEEFLRLADRCDAALGTGHAPAAADVVAQATFVCSLCDRDAGSVRLHGSTDKARVSRDSFTSRLTEDVSSTTFDGLRAALTKVDAAAVFDLSPELAPFYCPTCVASYCGDHWERWDVFDEDFPGWHDSIRGRCPNRHERMLED